MKKTLYFLLVLSLVFVLAACGGGSQPGGEDDSAGQPVTLRIFSAWAENNTMNDAMWKFQEIVAEESDGQITIEWGGGPEAIPPFELGESLRAGIVDIAWTAHTYNVSQIPVVEGAKFSELAPWEERESGAADFYDQVYQDNMNARYLGKGTPNLGFNMYTNFNVDSLDDFKGKVIRVTPAYAAFGEALGTAPVTTDPGEVYSALERNMVAGYGWPSVGTMDFGWDEVTEYVIEPSFYQVDVIALANANVWNQLTTEQQETIIRSMEKAEEWAYNHFAALIEEDRQKLADSGVTIIELDSALAEEYLNMANEAGWEKVLGNAPDKGAELQRLLEN